MLFEVGEIVKSRRQNGEKYLILNVNYSLPGFQILARNMRYGHTQPFTKEGWVDASKPDSIENLIPNRKEL